MNAQNLKNKINEEYNKVSVSSRQHTFVNILKENDINMTEARSNTKVVELYKEFISGTNVNALYEVVQMLHPYKNEDLFWNCAFTGIDGGFTGFVVVG